MLNIFKKKRLRKCCKVYISDKFRNIIIAAKHENNDGIIYEQKECYTSEYPIDASVLGEEIVRHLDMYSLKDDNLRFKKRSDWPAYKHSKSKSIRNFEMEYTSIFIQTANNRNLTLIIEGHPHKSSLLTINSSISFYADKYEIGKKVIDVYHVCLTGQVT